MSAHTWLTTRRTPAQGPHHTALKWTMVGPVRDRPRSLVSRASGAAVSRSTPERRLCSTPATAATPSAAAMAAIAVINAGVMIV